MEKWPGTVFFVLSSIECFWKTEHEWYEDIKTYGIEISCWWIKKLKDWQNNNETLFKT